MTTSKQGLCRIQFSSQGQVYEVPRRHGACVAMGAGAARNVSHGGMMGFVEVEKLVFGEKYTVVVDPSEEKLETESANIERFYVPLHSVIRIDEVSGKHGVARIHAVSGEGGSKVTPFPLYTAGFEPKK